MAFNRDFCATEEVLLVEARLAALSLSLIAGCWGYWVLSASYGEGLQRALTTSCGKAPIARFCLPFLR